VTVTLGVDPLTQKVVTDPASQGYSWSRSVTQYAYDAVGRQAGASGFSDSVNTTMLGTDEGGTGQITRWVPSTSKSHTNMIYALYGGESKILSSDTRSESFDHQNNRTGASHSVVSYRYDAAGRLEGAEGYTNSTSRSLVKNGDAWVEQTSTSRTVNQYEIVNGDAKVVRSVTDSVSMLAGVETGRSRSVVSYEYASNGLLTGATGESESTSKSQVRNGDAWVEQISLSRTQNVYAVILGEAKIVKSVTQSSTKTDGIAQGSSTSVTQYSFDSLGRLSGASGYSDSVNATLVKNGDDWVKQISTSHTVNQYAVIMGEARVLRSVTDSSTQTGGVDQGTSRSETAYEYDALGRLSGASGTTQSVNRSLVKNGDDWVEQVTASRTVTSAGF
jgi:hypothetical protein